MSCPNPVRGRGRPPINDWRTEEAIRLLVEGAPVKEIIEETGLGSSKIYELRRQLQQLSPEALASTPGSPNPEAGLSADSDASIPSLPDKPKEEE